MALRSTVFHVELAVADLDRGYYATHPLTLARHPSETDLRMMVRLLAFARHAHPALAFGRGLSSTDEPALWQRTPDGRIDLWIELGQPDPRRLRQACGRAAQVVVYTYRPAAARPWWAQHGRRLAALERLQVVHLPHEVQALTALVQPRMQLSCTLQDDALWFSDGARSVHLALGGPDDSPSRC